MGKVKAIITLLIGCIAVLLLVAIIFSVIPGLISISGGTFESKGSVIKFTLVVILVEFFIESLIAALYKVFTDHEASHKSFGFFVAKTISLFFIALIVGCFINGVSIAPITAILFALLYASITQIVENLLDN